VKEIKDSREIEGELFFDYEEGWIFQQDEGLQLRVPLSIDLTRLSIDSLVKVTAVVVGPVLVDLKF